MSKSSTEGASPDEIVASAAAGVVDSGEALGAGAEFVAGC